MQWADTIRENFDSHFWVPPGGAAVEPRPDLVHRTNIYKDSVGGKNTQKPLISTKKITLVGLRVQYEV